MRIICLGTFLALSSLSAKVLNLVFLLLAKQSNEIEYSLNRTQTGGIMIQLTCTHAFCGYPWVVDL